jgi:hypothetical protein
LVRLDAGPDENQRVRGGPREVAEGVGGEGVADGALDEGVHADGVVGLVGVQGDQAEPSQAFQPVEHVLAGDVAPQPGGEVVRHGVGGEDGGGNSRGVEQRGQFQCRSGEPGGVELVSGFDRQ